MMDLENKNSGSIEELRPLLYLRRCLTTYTTDYVRTAGSLYPFLPFVARGKDARARQHTQNLRHRVGSALHGVFVFKFDLEVHLCKPLL